MKSRALRAAILVLGVGAIVALPVAVLLGGKPGATQRTSAFEAGANAADFQAEHRNRTALLSPSATAVPVTPVPSPTQSRPAATREPTSPPPPVVPAFSHIFIIVMENHEYGSIIGSSAAPYINSLANSYGLATNYYGASHPSLPNYLALTAGSTFGITSDCTTCYVNATNIADQVEWSGRSWKAYIEDLPSPCYLGAASGGYAMKHNPFVYYTNIRNNAARCAAHVVPFTQFSSDMSRNQVPNYVWITPNMCNDMHDCSVATGDAWLKKVVPTITGSAAFRNNGVLFITFDEGTSNAGCCGGAWGGRVATVVISPKSTAGFRSAVAENHYGLLRTIEDAWHLPRLGAAGWSSTVTMREYFRG
jgi:phosphatidylinositol-3-phosphatase